jgi:hypothetical protein
VVGALHTEIVFSVFSSSCDIDADSILQAFRLDGTICLATY